MFRPNARCNIYRRSDASDRRGEYTFASPISVPCAVVTMKLADQKTSVRADSSGSRGKANEVAGDAKLLFPMYVTLKVGDIVSAEGEILEIISIWARRNVLGRFDHQEVVLQKSRLP